MVTCAVISCASNSDRDKGKGFFRIPKIIKNSDPERRDEALSTERQRQWLYNISRLDLPEKKIFSGRVCADHFVTGKPASLYERTNIDWAPTQNLSHGKLKNLSSSQISRRMWSKKLIRGRPKKRPIRQSRSTHEPGTPREAETRRTKWLDTTEPMDMENVSPHKDAEHMEMETVAPHNTLYQGPKPSTSASEADHNTPRLDEAQKEIKLEDAEHVIPIEDDPETAVGCQTDLSRLNLPEMEEYMKSKMSELHSLRGRVMECDFSEDSFKDDDEKTQFYTGIPNFLILTYILDLCAPYVSSTKNILPPFKELLLVLMRLRLNIPLQDLAYRFSVSKSCACRIFDKWIDILNVCLSFLIVWPERQQLRETMPMSFRENYDLRVAVIIDCFEIFVNRPINRPNKHHKTVKFLIGITPQGVVSFVSKAWAGRASDKYIAEHCGFLNKLQPGDIILAERGFYIVDTLGLLQASLQMPACTRGNSQLPAKEVEEDTRKLAHLRLHVERAIGLVRKKYLILHDAFPVEMIKVRKGDTEAPIDKIAKVCCALTNLSESVVPFESLLFHLSKVT